MVTTTDTNDTTTGNIFESNSFVGVSDVAEKNRHILSDFNEIHVFYPTLIIFTYSMRLILEEKTFN